MCSVASSNPPVVADSTSWSIMGRTCSWLTDMDVACAGDQALMRKAMLATMHCIQVPLPEPDLICAACFFLGSTVKGEFLWILH